MIILKGNTAAEFKKTNTYAIDYWVNYLITNVGGGSVTLNLYTAASPEVRIIPKNLELLTGETFEMKGVALPRGAQFRLTTTGSVDYYIALYENN